MSLVRPYHLTAATQFAAAAGGQTPPAPAARDNADADAGFRSSRLRGLHPGWFGGVMGTGILAIAAYQNPGGAASLLTTAHAVGETLGVATVILAAALVIAYVARWIAHFDAAVADLRHPVLGPLYGLFPGGLLIVAVLVNTMGSSFLPAGAIIPTIATLTIIGGVLAFAIAATFTYLLFTGETDAQAVNGGWLIPPVVNIIVPMGLAPLISQVGPSIGRLIMALSYAYFGIGFFLFILVISMVHDRLVLHPLPHASLAPSLWIFLGPIGAGSLALLVLAKAGAHFFGPAAPAVGVLTLLVVSALWGFGMWALTAATLMLVRYLREGPLPYGLGWWGFTFPIGAYTVLTLNLARAWQSGWIEGFAVALFIALAGFWLVVATRTVWAVFTGEAWRR
jgi:C4-dicarboxylate transporter/malic acid transport protein